MPYFCPDCQVWEILPTDNFCSYCRRRFISIGMSLYPRCIPAGEVRQITLVIHNLSDEKPIQIDDISASADWLSADFSHVGLPFSLLPKTDFEMLLFADTDGLESTEAEVRVESNAGNDSAPLQVLPVSEIRMEAEQGGKFELILDDRPKEPVSVQILAVSGGVTLREIVSSLPQFCTPVSFLPLPAQLHAGGEPTVLRFRFSRDHVMGLGASGKRDVSCRISARFTDPFENEIECGVDLTVSCWEAPQMIVWEESNPEWTGIAGETQVLRLRIQNSDRALLQTKGRAPLELRDITVRDLSGAAIPWIRLKTPFIPALRIESGQTGIAEFEVMAQESDAAPVAGEYIVQFVFATNLHTEHPPLDFRLVIRESPVLDGILALDFGTSNSCAAYLGWTEEECIMGQIESRDRSLDQTKSPTLTQFLALENEKPVTDYGARVLNKLSAPETANTVVQSVKRLLGRTDEADRIPVQFENDRLLKRRYLPREVTAFYLAHLRRSLEKTSGLRFRRLAITHPARFKLGQIEDLKQAVREAFGPVEMTCYQEPIAAGLKHILSRAGEFPDSYVLGVFDSGGGTTDLSLIRVERSIENGIEELSATLLASSGKWFGGEDVTLEVSRHAVRNIQADWQKNGVGALVVSENDRPEMLSFAKYNESALWAWAEQAKLQLLDPNGNQTDNYPYLYVLTNDGLDKRKVESNIRPQAPDIEDFLRRNISELADMLRDLAAKHQVSLDTVLLSGMNGSFPLVKAVLQEKFPGSEIVQAYDPKRCVAQGACYLEAIFRDALAMRLKVNGRAATVSRIGFADRGRLFLRRFTELIAAGVPIPDGGLCSEARVLFLRPGTVIDLLENDTADDTLAAGNAHITSVGRFGPDPDFALPEAGARVEVQLCVTPDLECRLSGRLAGSEDPFHPFVRITHEQARQRGTL